MNNKWHKFNPDKGLPHATVVLAFCKDGKTYAGTQSHNDVNKWDVLRGHCIEDSHDVSEILYWTENLGSPPEVIKVFISQPMTGRTDEEITEERIKAISAVQKRYPLYYVMEIDSFNKGALNNSDPITELGKCVSLMADTDVVAFCNGWVDSKGCNVEHEVADQYGIPCVYL